MSHPGTLTWFARHETRLAWRDWISMITAGRRRRLTTVVVALAAFVAFMHLIAYPIVKGYAQVALAPDKTALVVITGMLALSWSLMASQAMELVTRAFYSRADLDLILSSPAAARTLFAVRIATMTLATALMSLLLASPFINVLAALGGVRWLAAYLVVVAISFTAMAFAVAVTIALFMTLGPKRTRLVAQVMAAVIGAACVIGLQLAAIQSLGTLSRTELLSSSALVALAPASDSILYWPARAAVGDLTALAGVFGASVLLLGTAIALFAPRFGDCALAAGSVAKAATRKLSTSNGFRQATPRRVLRLKEWLLLKRDPWLVSQSLMQILYLVPPAVLLWQGWGEGAGAAVVLVPVLVMAAGQLAGGLAWLAISGEDAPELVATAPVSAAHILRAKDRGGDGRDRSRVPAVRRRHRADVAVARDSGLARHHRGLGRGDPDPAFLPHPGQAQPFPPAADVVARRDLRGSIFLDRLGRHRGARRRRHVARRHRRRVRGDSPAGGAADQPA